MLVVGLDLAGVESRPSGLGVLIGLNVETCLIFSDLEIVKRIEELQPAMVAVDAPLSLPAGRKSIEQRTKVHLRECDRELLKRRIRFFPITLGPMRKLTQSGIKLKAILESRGFRIVEVYPGGAQDVLGIARKQEGLDKLRSGLAKLGIRGLNDRMTHDELDAVTAAFVGKLHLEGKAEVFGERDGEIVMPLSRRRKQTRVSSG